jgi:hypothetical protein
MTTVLNGGDIPPTADGTGLDVAPQPTAISKQLAESAGMRKSTSGSGQVFASSQERALPDGSVSQASAPQEKSMRAPNWALFVSARPP